MKQLPILYSLQNCPYAIRARFSLFRAKQNVFIRAIKLNNKPSEMLKASSKGSVPVLVVAPLNIIEESLDIMQWALHQNDPYNLLHVEEFNAEKEMLNLINNFDATFIPALEKYSCAKRYHESNLVQCRETCENILRILEHRLEKHTFLFSDKESIFDIAVFPFIRKFARVERQWYRNSPYPKLRDWLANYLQCSSFTKVMANHELWLENKKDIIFGSDN